MSVIHFGTDGWRGLLAADFTFQNVRAVARAIARYLKREAPGQACLIGYDNRFLAEEMAAIAWEVLHEEGITAQVTDQPTPTPVLAHAVQRQKAGGAIMFTASHNPPRYQGMKFIPWYAGPATPAITQELQEVANKVAPQERIDGRVPAAIPIFDPAPDYWAHLGGLVNLERLKASGLTLAYDAMYGVGAPYMAALSPAIFLHGERDPLFGGITPEPTGEGLQPLIQAMQESGADLGLANDGDADRFGCVDPVAGYLSANQVLTLMLTYLLTKRNLRGKVVRTLATTHLLDRIAAAHNCPVIETPVGFKYLAQAMLEGGVLLAGEESGGLSIGGHIPEKDGILANLLLAQMRLDWGKPLGQVLEEIYGQYGRPHAKRIDLHLHQGDRARIEAALQAATPVSFGGQAVQSVDRRDGYKFRLAEEAWLLLRFSGTEPLVRVYGEAPTAEMLEAILRDALEEVAQV
ncbi:MAG TPA: phosphoglucomutase/phosphomannomutase family protein [Symbiobacteriaceae bacterium]|nr:phosphoglucomutase/phosphomannomutase family protein [Symbiobacteriaceae bacterium]